MFFPGDSVARSLSSRQDTKPVQRGRVDDGVEGINASPTAWE